MRGVCKMPVFLILMLTLSVPAAAARDDIFKRGLKAYNNSDYETAERLFKKLAEKGEPKSQRYLGQMYDKGLGVPQNYKKAVTWYRKAAEQKDPAAQYHLGVKYVNGHGVPLDAKTAYVWFAISFNNGFERAANPLRVLNKSLSTRDRQDALKLVSQKMETLSVNSIN